MVVKVKLDCPKCGRQIELEFSMDEPDIQVILAKLFCTLRRKDNGCCVKDGELHLPCCCYEHKGHL